MFNFFHPKPVGDGRPVAVKVVQQKTPAHFDRNLLVVDAPGTPAAGVGPAGQACAQLLSPLA